MFRKLTFALLPLALWCGLLTAADSYKKDPGPSAVDSVRYDWTDAQRQRRVPVKIYSPKADLGPFPLIIFSHGLGGSREGYEFLGRHWASHGYICVHVQHIGSDSPVLGNRNPPARVLQEGALLRPVDVTFAIDQMLKLNSQPGPFQGRISTNAIGVAGHSFGSYTTLAIAGQLVGLTDRSFRDPRVKAAIAMSSPVPKLADKNKIYTQIHIPILHMTGTEDYSPIGETSAPERRIPFDHIQGPQYLITFTGGDHMIFSGRWGTTVPRQKLDRFHTLIQQSSIAFWDAFLKNDTAAKTWLTDGPFEKALSQDGRFEQKK